MLYLDSSALVKLFVEDDEASTLRDFVGFRDDLISSALALVEVTRIGRVQGGEAIGRARATLARLQLVGVDRSLLVVAAGLAGPRLRSLDAVHVAAAQTLGVELDALITYDRQMQDAARELGLPVASPGQGAR